MRHSVAVAGLVLFLSAVPIAAQDRFPRPEFKSDYEIPSLQVPDAAGTWFEYIDLGLLAVMLTVVSICALKLRSRNAITLCSFISLVYFGFVRQGCICPIGSIQNVVLSLSDPGYSIPLFVAGFFLLPLLAALFTGRTFCAGVCPLGAIQDIVALKPIKIPRFLDKALSLIPWVYLSIAVLAVVSNLGFLVCKFDPFVEIFRFGSRLPNLIWGGALLLIGVFVARPYCRFLCPYGAILGLLSRVSFLHISIAPKECVNCRLCENSCPFNAIIPATEAVLLEKPRAVRKRLLFAFAILPLAIVLGAGTGLLLPGFLENTGRDVQIAGELAKPLPENGQRSLDAQFFEETGMQIETLEASADKTKAVLAMGSPIAGGFAGLVAGLLIIGLSIPRKNREYIPDRGACVSCGRCIEYCPKEHERRSKDYSK
ncbi:MAG: 4Fe-4S binding protein [Spirochaetaceae bacterium]|nr:MAG: 4Fe-4S binding protein [Spirochaetaceae bacterium]